MIQGIIRSISFGFGIGASAYVYNQFGHRLSDDAGYVRPALVFGGILGMSAIFCKAALPTRFVWPAVILTGGGLTLTALNNSIREVRENQKISDS